MKNKASPRQDLFDESKPRGFQRVTLFFDRHIQFCISHSSITCEMITHQIQTSCIETLADA